MKFRIGMSSWSLLLHPILKATEMIGKRGFESIELWAERPHAYPGSLEYSTKSRIRNIIKNYGMHASIHAPFHDFNIATVYPGIRKQIMHDFIEVLEFANFLECSTVTMHPGFISTHPGYQKLIPIAKEGSRVILEKCSDSAEKFGLRIGFENMTIPPPSTYMHKFGTTIGELLRSIREIQSKRLGITLDPGHLNVNRGDFKAFINKAGKNLVQVHVSNNDGSGDQHQLPGRGTIDYRSLLITLEKIGYKGDLTLEIEPSLPIGEIMGSKEDLQRFMN